MKINWFNHLIELLIVIIGITVAFWLNNLSSTAKEKSLEKVFIADLREDLIKDSSLLSFHIEFNKNKIGILGKGLVLMQSTYSEKKVDSLIMIGNVIGNYDFFKTESYMLTSLLQSGDIKLITSRELKKELIKLLKLYEMIETSQRNHLQALDNNFFPVLLTKVDMMSRQTDDPRFFYGMQMRNYCAWSINDVSVMVKEYQATVRQITVILALMEGL